MRTAMIGRRLTAVAVALGLCALAACGDKPQTAGTKKSDAEPWSGGDAAYTAAGWSQGDRASWEQQMKARNQNQNEYTRVR